MKNELFLFLNNDLGLYSTDGDQIQRRDFDYNIKHALQDQDSLILTYENGTMACYDWNVDKIIDEWEDFGNVRSMGISR